MRKAFWLFPVLIAAIVAPNAKADTVQIGTLSTSPMACPPGTVNYCGTVSLTNGMSDTDLIITTLDFDGTLYPLPGGPSTLLPGASGGLGSFYNSTRFPTSTVGFSGQLGSIEFTVSGESYDASGLDWATPSMLFYPYFTVPIDVTATPTPEPATVRLILAGVGLLGLLLRKRIPLGHQHAS